MFSPASRSASGGDLGPAAFGQPDPRHAAGQHAAAEIVLAMAQQMQQRHAAQRASASA